MPTDPEKDAQEIQDIRKLFETELGQKVLRALCTRFGYDLPDFEDHHTIHDIKPHERRGMKMPLRHIVWCLNQTIKPNPKEYATGKVTTKESRPQDGSEEDHPATPSAYT